MFTWLFSSTPTIVTACVALFASTLLAAPTTALGTNSQAQAADERHTKPPLPRVDLHIHVSQSNTRLTAYAIGFNNHDRFHVSVNITDSTGNNSKTKQAGEITTTKQQIASISSGTQSNSQWLINITLTGKQQTTLLDCEKRLDSPTHDVLISCH